MGQCYGLTIVISQSATQRVQVFYFDPPSPFSCAVSPDADSTGSTGKRTFKNFELTLSFVRSVKQAKFRH